jgi:hypothetical protein
MTTIHSNLFYGDRREEDTEVMVRWGEDSEYLRNVGTKNSFT